MNELNYLTAEKAQIQSIALIYSLCLQENYLLIYFHY